MYEAVVVADSISPEGHRITSVYTVYPHAVHKDFLRHGLLRARSVESFRARPTELLIEALENGDVFCPDEFAARVVGMAQGEAVEGQEAANLLWDEHVDHCLYIAREMGELDIAKQQRNFVLQDLCPLKEIITATDWDNFFALRLELDDEGRPVARPEIYKTALAIKEAIDVSTPTRIGRDSWHLPLVTVEEAQAWIVKQGLQGRCKAGDRATWDEIYSFWVMVSVGRCARFSYAKGFVPEDPQVSFERAQRLTSQGHMVPFEHAARPFSDDEWAIIGHLQERAGMADVGVDDLFIADIKRQLECSSSLHGWRPYRKMIPNEHDYSLLQAAAAS